MNIKKFAALGAAFGVVIAGFGATSAAQADPVTDGYSIVGSDTLQDAVSALANGTTITGASVKVTGAGKALASWDAFALGISGGVGSIQTKPFGPTFPRPAGSGDGRNSLLASAGGINPSSPSYTWNGINVQNQVDLARSSSVSGTAGTTLTYVPFGQDAIGYVYKIGNATGTADAAAAKAVVEDLTKAQLTAIYSASTSAAASSALSGTGFSLKPLALQSSSGTWTTFLGKIGVSSVGDAVDKRGNTIPENDGRVLTPADNEIQIVPLSIANYIGQVNGAARINTMAGVTAGAIGGVAPYTGTAPALVPSTSYYNSADWGRTVYIVVPTAKLATDSGLASLVDTTSPSSLTYWNTGITLPNSSKAVKIKFGFSAPTGTTVTRNG